MIISKIFPVNFMMAVILNPEFNVIPDSDGERI